MTRIFLFAFILFAVTTCAQTVNDSLWMEGSRIMNRDYEITPAAALDIMKSSPEACVEMRKAKANRTFSNVLGAAGGFLVGFSLGQMIGGGDPNWTMTAIGGGVILAGIPFAVSYKHHARTAVSIYNSRELKTSIWELEINPGEVNLVLRF